MLGKNFSSHFELFFYIFSQKIDFDMYESSKPIF